MDGRYGVFWGIRVSNANSGEKNHMYGKHHSEETKQLISDNHADFKGENHPNYGKHHSDETKQKMSDAALGEKSSMYGKHHTEETKEKMSEAKLGEKNHNFGRTCEKSHRYGKTHSEETKRKQRDATSGEKNHNFGKTFSDAIRQKMRENHADNSGEKHPNWKGGMSFEPYCIKFNNEFKDRVRDFFDRTCYVCGKSEQEQIDEMIKAEKRQFKKLDVHHVNYDKMMCCNDVKPLFVPLCRSCHTKTNTDREYWEEFFTVSLEYLTQGECFIPK